MVPKEGGLGDADESSPPEAAGEAEAGGMEVEGCCAVVDLTASLLADIGGE